MDRLSQLGIDLWSIVIYIANTGVVLAVLTYFLFKPILKFIDARRKHIADSIEEANLLREEFSKKLATSEAEKKKMEAELRQEMQNLQKFLETKRIELISEMETTRTEMMRKAQNEIDERKASLIKDTEKEVMAIMTRIILEIVQNKVPENVVQESIHDSWKQYLQRN